MFVVSTSVNAGAYRLTCTFPKMFFVFVYQLILFSNSLFFIYPITSSKTCLLQAAQVLGLTTCPHASDPPRNTHNPPLGVMDLTGKPCHGSHTNLAMDLTCKHCHGSHAQTLPWISPAKVVKGWMRDHTLTIKIALAIALPVAFFSFCFRWGHLSLAFCNFNQINENANGNVLERGKSDFLPALREKLPLVRLKAGT